MSPNLTSGSNMSKRSRLNRRLEKQTKQNLALSIFGIFFVLFLLIKFGLPLLANFVLLLPNTKTPDNTQSKTSAIVTVPQLNPVPTATNSANLKISGKTIASDRIDLYVNDNTVDKTQADNNGNFSFDVILIRGGNKIYVKAREGSNISSASDTFDVIFKDTPPSLTLNSPSDGQQFSKDQSSANITGKTDQDVKITVNGFWAIVDQNNNFSYNLPLQSGDNTIKIVGQDLAGNITEKDIKVKYSP